jgi:hypothetical protein
VGGRSTSMTSHPFGRGSMALIPSSPIYTLCCQCHSARGRKHTDGGDVYLGLVSTTLMKRPVKLSRWSVGDLFGRQTTSERARAFTSPRPGRTNASTVGSHRQVIPVLAVPVASEAAHTLIRAHKGTRGVPRTTRSDGGAARSLFRLSKSGHVVLRAGSSSPDDSSAVAS